MKKIINEKLGNLYSAATIKNLLANYLGKAWATFSIFAFVPIYIKLLGSEAYGLVSFYATVAMLVSVLNMGISAALTRYLAREKISQSSLDTFRSVEYIFLIIALLVIILIFLSSKWIATSWLTTVEINVEIVSKAIKLMSAVAVLEIFFSIYFGAFMALEEQVKANFYQFLFSLFRYGIVIPIIYFFPDILSFFYWMLFSTILVLVYVRREFWKNSIGYQKSYFSVASIIPLKSFAIGMGIIGLLSALNSQVDKLVISSLFTKRFSGL